MYSIKLYYSKPYNYAEVQQGQILSFLLCKFPQPSVSNNPTFWFNLEQYFINTITGCSFSYRSDFTGTVNYTYQNKPIFTNINYHVHDIRALFLLRNGYSITEQAFSSIKITDPLNRSNIYTDSNCSCEDFINQYSCYHIDLIKFYQKHRDIFNHLANT
jgi:hypothetical protein